MTSIGDIAFQNCSGLTSIVIPDGVTSIGDGAFRYCSSLINMVTPEGVTSISNAAFHSCSRLSNIVIPEGVTLIGDAAFYNCQSLANITCLATNPPALGNNALYNVPGSIYVPAASVEAYKAADGWKDYASKIQAIPE